VAANYGWQAVFVMAVGLNAAAALLALFVIKPMRRAFILGSEVAGPNANARNARTA
jgi:OFA family oxalate/formate antiporter-like MFS transporter